MKTINLRNDQTQPHMPLLIFVGVIALLFVVNVTPQQAHVDSALPTPALSYIIVIATPTAPPIVPTEAPILAQTAPTMPAPTPQPQIIVERVIVQQVIVVATPTEGPPLQTFAVQSDEEPLSPALLREAMDQ